MHITNGRVGWWGILESSSRRFRALRFSLQVLSGQDLRTGVYRFRVEGLGLRVEGFRV